MTDQDGYLPSHKWREPYTDVVCEQKLIPLDESGNPIWPALCANDPPLDPTMIATLKAIDAQWHENDVELEKIDDLRRTAQRPQIAGERRLRLTQWQLATILMLEPATAAVLLRQPPGVHRPMIPVPQLPARTE
jgi:hypothetical protein